VPQAAPPARMPPTYQPPPPNAPKVLSARRAGEGSLEFVTRPPEPVHTYVDVPAAAPIKVGVGLVLKERPDGSHTVKRLKPGQSAGSQCTCFTAKVQIVT
jgi:hypothetical protein